MTPTETQILALLERKPELTQFTPTYRWLIESVEVLLRQQLELPSAQTQIELAEKLSHQLELSFELVEELRNASILR